MISLVNIYKIQFKIMAKYLSTTFGKISGKHGTAVAAVVNGESILKIFTPPSNPNTQGQLIQRLKFGMVLSSLNPLRNVITVGFGDKRGYYQAASFALRNAVTGTYPDLSINYPKIILSSGSLPQSPAVTIAAPGDMNVSVSWDKTVWSNGSSDDPVFIAFLNPVTQMVVFSEAQAKRDDGTLNVLLPAPWLGATLHVWLFFNSVDRKQSSVSQYAGTIIPA
jgi:hypothetical protein